MTQLFRDSAAHFEPGVIRAMMGEIREMDRRAGGIGKDIDFESMLLGPATEVPPPLPGDSEVL